MESHGYIRGIGRWTRNVELGAYKCRQPWPEPTLVHQGLALYSRGLGVPVLVMPYPHGLTMEPMIVGPIADLLVSMGYRVISFDPPGAYRSTRYPRVDMEEMVACSKECLELLLPAGPVLVVGHSMGALCALAFAVEHPGLVSALVLEGGLSGFPASTRHGLPGKHLPFWSTPWRRYVFGGLATAFGLATLAQLQSFWEQSEELLVVEPSKRVGLVVNTDFVNQACPVRCRWTLQLFSALDYAAEISGITVPVLVMVGALDKQTPPACSQEIADNLAYGSYVLIPGSGHCVHRENPTAWKNEVQGFILALD